MLTSKIKKETVENWFQFDLDISWNYLWCCYEKDTSAPLLPFRGAIPPLSGVLAYRYQQSLSLCIPYQDSHAPKRLLSQREVNIRRFFAMVFLHNKDQQ